VTSIRSFFIGIFVLAIGSMLPAFGEQNSIFYPPDELINQKQNDLKYSATKIAECAGIVIRQYAELHDIVMEAVDNSKWLDTYALKDNYSILIQTNGRLIFYHGRGDVNSEALNSKLMLETLSDSQKPKVCIGKLPDRGIQFHYFIIDSLGIIPSKDDAYEFIYSLNGESPLKSDYFTKLANSFGKLLFIKLDNMDQSSLIEAGRTIIHEGMHLYGQQNIIAAQPTPPDRSLSSRTYLQALSPDFNNLVQKEICLDAKLVAKISKNPDKNRDEIIDILVDILAISSKRQDLFSTGPLEAYWYVLEGLPQYLDQKYLMKKNSDKLVRLYENFCSDAQAQTKIFFPTLAGAAIFLAFDTIFKDEKSWMFELRPDYDQIQKWRLNLMKILYEKILSIT